jgi:hypothetical protein
MAILGKNEILQYIKDGKLAIDPTETSVKVRYRIDGLLYDIASLSKEYYIPLLGEIKTSAGFATNLKKATYDGRFAIITESPTTNNMPVLCFLCCMLINIVTFLKNKIKKPLLI